MLSDLKGCWSDLSDWFLSQKHWLTRCKASIIFTTPKESKRILKTQVLKVSQMKCETALINQLLMMKSHVLIYFDGTLASWNFFLHCCSRKSETNFFLFGLIALHFLVCRKILLRNFRWLISKLLWLKATMNLGLNEIHFFCVHR